MAFQITCVFLTAHSIGVLKNLLRYTDFKEVFLWANVLGVQAHCLYVWLYEGINHPELFRGVILN